MSASSTSMLAQSFQLKPSASISRISATGAKIREKFEAGSDSARTSICCKVLSAPFDLLKRGCQGLYSLAKTPLGLSKTLKEEPAASIARIRTSDPEIRETFEDASSSTRTPICRKVLSAPFHILSWGYRSLRSLAQIPLRPQVYYASSGAFKKKMDPIRLEKSRQDLRKIGGQTVAVKTEDGDWIEAMYFDIDNFKRAVVDQGGQFYIDEEGNQSIRSYDVRLTALLTETLRFKGQFKDDPELNDVQYFEVPFPKCSLVDDRLISDKHVNILTQGNACIYEMNRARIGEILKDGQGCLVFNIRGTGRSNGKPNEQRTYFDMQAMYRFLKSKGFRDEQITVHGYCLGSGIATDLASKYPVNLILDRPFARITDVIADLGEEMLFEHFKINPDESKSRLLCLRKPMKKFVSSCLNHSIISYDNLSKIKDVAGPICYLHSDIDEVIPEFSREMLQKELTKRGAATIQTSDRFGHNDSWDEKTTDIHEDHLKRHKIFGRYPNTSVPAHISLSRLAQHKGGLFAKRSKIKRSKPIYTGEASSSPSGALIRYRK